VINVIRSCPKCGAEIPGDAPEGGCPGCLLESGLRLLDEEAVAGVDLSAVAAYSAEAAAKAGSAKADDPGRPASPMPATARFAEMLGELGDYELLEEIGRGGQGVVFRARQKSLNRTVALKVISLGQWASKAHLKRFRREAEAAANLDHPNIVPIYEVGERDGSCYFSMKFIEGGQLDEVVRRTPMSIRHAAELIAKVARTVHYAHEHGIVHRDIKPGNILLDAKGEPHLTDFGLARLVESESTVTRTMEVMGTPSYMAPEQAVGNNTKLTSATDVYGLGAVLYQMLTGRPPFAGGTTYETIKLLLDTAPRPPGVLNPKIDRELSTICLKCLEKDPKCRYSSAVALAEDLEHWEKHEPIQAKPSGFFTHSRKWVRRKPATAALIASLLTLAAAMAWNVWESELFRAPPERSIAVLPFKNSSRDPDNAYFADGVQDEILTNLARIADLKVISRSSTMQYKSEVARNLREIGHQLGVARVVEGSVQRTGNRVRVSAQLIDARTDRHLWAQTYDRDLADVFAIQSELAQKIADELRAKLSPSEKAQIERRPTENSEAYLAFMQGHEIFNRPDKFRSNTEKAEQLFEKATKLDPNFAGAFAALAWVHDWNYHDFDPTPARKEKARAAAVEALRLQPNLPEAHLAMGFYYYYCERDYRAALDEFAIAKQSLPNSPEAYLAIGAIERRQGKWEQSTVNLERAASLSPKDAWVLQNLADNYYATRNFEAADKILDRAIEVAPQSFALRAEKAKLAVDWKGDLSVLEKELTQVPPGADPDGVVTFSRVQLLLLQRKFSDALAVLQHLPGSYYDQPKELFEGAIYTFLNDREKALATFERARLIAEKALSETPDDASRHVTLGLILAGLGEKEAAIVEGKRAVELLPESQDAVDGPQMTVALAQIYASTGESGQALQLLERSLSTPNGITSPLLRLDPIWDPLRSDPRFRKLCEEKKP
jgi:serine/threonine protein kinase/Flp pilus assembly protein TadD